MPSLSPPAGKLPALVAASFLMGCPFAQPVPGVEHQDGGTITPPRIDVASVVPSDTMVLYQSPCTTPFSLQADVLDENMTDTVQTRWFVDYDPANQTRSNYVHHEDFGPPPEDPTQVLRTIPVTWSLQTDDWPGTTHVVELVISNGFASDNGRTPAAGYETQVFRWIFLYSTSGRCGP
jgi:hypothetical protein